MQSEKILKIVLYCNVENIWMIQWWEVFYV